MKSVVSKTAWSATSWCWNDVIHWIFVSFLIFNSFFQFIKGFDLHHITIRGYMVFMVTLSCAGIDNGFDTAFDMIFHIVSSSVESYQISIDYVNKDCNWNYFCCLHFFLFSDLIVWCSLRIFRIFIRNDHAKLNREEAAEVLTLMLLWDHFLLWNNRLFNTFFFHLRHSSARLDNQVYLWQKLRQCND